MKGRERTQLQPDVILFNFFKEKTINTEHKIRSNNKSPGLNTTVVNTGPSVNLAGMHTIKF